MDEQPTPPVRYFMAADLTIHDQIAQVQVKVSCGVEGESPEALTAALAGKLRAMADGFMQADAPVARVAQPGSVADMTRCPRCGKVMPLRAGEYPNQVMHRGQHPFLVEYDCPHGCGCRIMEESGKRSVEVARG